MVEICIIIIHCNIGIVSACKFGSWNFTLVDSFNLNLQYIYQFITRMKSYCLNCNSFHLTRHYTTDYFQRWIQRNMNIPYKIYPYIFLWVKTTVVTFSHCHLCILYVMLCAALVQLQSQLHISSIFMWGAF